jgi:CheY-like chemotaxis protein
MKPRREFETPPPEEDDPMTQARILIADDDVAFATAISERLKANGYATAISYTGYEALMAALSHNPHLMMLDINMPMGNGFSIHERIRKIREHSLTPVVFISGEPVEWLERAAMDHGAYAFLRKPVDDALLLATVKQALDDTMRFAA